MAREGSRSASSHSVKADCSSFSPRRSPTCRAHVRNTDLDLANRHLREAVNIQLELNDAGSIADSVRLLARIRRDADPRAAARLIGFADALRRWHGVGVSAHDQNEIAEEVDALKNLIGEDSYEAEFVVGAEMREQQGLDLAVSLLAK